MWLVKLFVKDYKDVTNQRVREGYGNLAGIVGIVINLLLSGLKFVVGSIGGSVAITADAANNLSDAASSVISIVSFKLANRPADEEHPFGHARIEYVASMAVAVIIFIIAFQLVLSSFDKILHPEIVPFSWLAAAVLLGSILGKLWLFFLNKKLGRMIDSSVMQATAMDSISDVYATGAVLISSILSPIIGFSLDGYMGLVVAGFIVWAGIQVMGEALNKLLGQAPDKELIGLVVGHIKKHEGVLGVHDIMAHSYGPGRHFISLHVEVDAKADVLESHDMVDNIERELFDDHGIHLVIHMDPIVTDDARTNEMRARVWGIVHEIGPELGMHDFRMVPGETHTNLIFDVTVPYGFSMQNSQIIRRIRQAVRELDGNHYAVVTIDRVYAGGSGF